MWFKTNRIDKKGSCFWSLFKLIFLLSVGFLVYFYMDYSNFKNNILVEKDSIIEIKEWYTIDDIAKEFNLNNYYLKYYYKEHLEKINPDFELIAWNYKINKNSNIADILISLEEPIVYDEIDITVLEWWNIFDIDKFLTDKKLIKSWEYISYAENTDKIKKLTEFFPFLEWLKTLEWFLYPDTYTVLANDFKINVFVIKQLETFENKVYKTILTELDNKQIEELVNLSSIVEKEEKNKNEKATVAGILKKRLDEWWMIGADITVCYAHELTSEDCKMVVSKYIKEKSDYNTRTMKWLPKTPIWNPSFETINATLNYKETPYWFYLHDITTWKIYYWKSNEEHEKNKRLYLK